MNGQYTYPKITIVTPSFNQGLYIEETITSVISQNYPNLEYIIIDGGSTDNSVDIIKKYEKHLTYWVSEKDRGLYHAIDKGFKRSTGEIMAWINSDDIYHKKSLFSIAEVFRTFPQINWIMGKNTYYNNNGFLFNFDTNYYNECWSKWRLYSFNRSEFIQQESVFWRRSLWEKAGGNIRSDLKLAGDFELWLRFFRHENLYSTNLIFSSFRFRKGQKSKDQFDIYLNEMDELIKQEIKHCKAAPYLTFRKIIKPVIKLIPKQRWQKKLWFKIIGIVDKIEYDEVKGLTLVKAYRF